MSCTKARTDFAQRQFVANRVATVVVSLSLLAATFAYRPYADSGPVLCALRGTVGLPCPACGLTRAFCALARFDFRQAVGSHAFCLPLAALLIAAPVVALYELSRGRRATWYRFMYSMQFARWAAATLIVYHLARVAVWLFDGTLVEQYLRTSWTYRLFFS